MSLFFKKKKNSNTESELLIFANESNEKIITNSMLKEQIFQHETFIKIIKKIFDLIDNKNPKDNYTIKEPEKMDKRVITKFNIARIKIFH